MIGRQPDHKRSLIPVGVGALLFALYIGFNVMRTDPGDGLLGPIVHWVALVGGLAVLGWMAMRHSSPSPLRPSSSAGYRETLQLLASALDATDPFTRGRAYRLSTFCVSVGKELGLAPAEIEDLEYAALLHDIGKTAIHHDILSKPRRLSAKERGVVQSHPRVAYEILKEIPQLSRAAHIIHAHHEQPDGLGYPRGLKGAKEIPVGSRIIMVAAAFDAMTSDRPYRPGLSPKEAYQELRKSKGTMFFPGVVEAFIKLHSSGAMFEHFDQDELNKYALGEYSTRALEDYLSRDAVPEGTDIGNLEDSAA